MHVWNDINADGLQDITEPPILGATAELIRDPDGIAGNADDVSVFTLVSGYLSSSLSSSRNLDPHYIVFRPPVTDPPIPFSFTTPNVGSNDGIDSDADSVTGRTAHFVFDGSSDFDCGMIGDFPVVNSPPSFNKGSDITVNEYSESFTQANWATAISQGLPYESPQSVHFEVTRNTGPSLFAVGPAISPNGTLTFTPAAGAAGTVTIDVVLKDDGGTANGGQDTSWARSFFINIIRIGPTFTKGPDVTVGEDSGLFTQEGWATNILGPPLANREFQVSASNGSLFAVHPAISSDGTLTFRPADDAFGSTTVTVRLLDTASRIASQQQTFTITINPLNDPPVFTKGPDVMVDEDSGQFTQTGWATGIGGSGVDNRQFEIIANSNPRLFFGIPDISSIGTLTFTPADNAFGSATIRVQLREENTRDVSPPQEFTISVNPVNDSPTFVIGPNISVIENSGPVTKSGWARDVEAGVGEGQTVAFQVTANSNPSLFSIAPTISPDGMLSFTPAIYAFGVATVTIQLQDDSGTGNDTSVAESFTITIHRTLTVVGVDAGSAPRVGLFSAGGIPYDEFRAYAPSFRGGVRVAVGDVNGDGVRDIVTAPGAGMAANIKVWSGDGGALLAHFRAFPDSYQDGAHVATGNFDADSAQEIVVGRAKGKGQVKIFDAVGEQVTPLCGFVAFADGGVSVAAGDFDGLARAEVIAIQAQTARRVKVFGVSDGTATLQKSILAHSKDPTGAFVAAADLTGDLLVEIIVGTVDAAAPRVKLFSGGSGDFLDGFTPYVPTTVKSVRVGTVDLDGDGYADTIVTAPGPGTLGPLIKRFDALTLDLIDDFFAYGPNGGAFVAG